MIMGRRNRERRNRELAYLRARVRTLEIEAAREYVRFHQDRNRFRAEDLAKKLGVV